MKMLLQKDSFLNSIKAVRGIVNGRTVQPILASILLEAKENKVKLTTTDLTLSMAYTTEAKIEEEGITAISAKFIDEIVAKLPDEKEILLESNSENNLIKIQSEKTKYEVVSLNSEEFPNVFNQIKRPTDVELEEKEFEISTKELNKAIKQTVFSAVQNEVGGVLSGISFIIKDNILEMVATDGNRLTRSRVPINCKNEEISFICTYRTLIEVSRLITLAPDKTIKFVIKGSKISFVFENIIFQSSLIEGNYPKYQQLIPTNNEKTAIIDRETLIDTIDRISVMANNRTNIMKFNFENSSLEISTDSPDAGSAKEGLDIQYEADNLIIAFNYKYILDVLRNITSKLIKIEMSTSLSASVIKPGDEEEDETKINDYLCLIMPVQVR